MVTQLTLAVDDRIADTAVDRAVARLVADWSTRTGAATQAAIAGRITARRFSDRGHLSARDLERIESYYTAVLRRRILSSSDGEARVARSRLLARSIQEDLVRGGWEPARARAEAHSVVGLPQSA